MRLGNDGLVGIVGMTVGFGIDDKTLSLGFGRTRTRLFAVVDAPPEDFLGPCADFTVPISLCIYENGSA